LIRVQEADFDPGAAIAALGGGRTGLGGICAFVGLVRDFAQDAAAVRALTLEHYPAMAARALARIERAARARWPGVETLIIHRVGRLTPGERIVLVAAAAAHRDDAFAACRFLIDVLKTEAPFWKAEETAAGRRWVEACTADEAAARAWLSSAGSSGGNGR
jgi:molybdopterin synthase catalytic subunit